MGKLKSSIDNVVKSAGMLEKMAGSLLDERAKLTHNYLISVDFCRGGSESIYMYLMEKFKMDGEKIEDHKKDTLKTVIDANIAKMIKELVSGQSRVVKHLAAGDKNLQLGKAVKDNVGRVRKDITAINGVISKKKKKWLTSKIYKNKLKGYESAISDLDAQLADLDKNLPGQTYGKYVEPKVWKISIATTVAEIQAGASTYLTADIKMRAKDDAAEAKKFRGRGFAKSLQVMKEWVKEADEMEKEG